MDQEIAIVKTEGEISEAGSTQRKLHLSGMASKIIFKPLNCSRRFPNDNNSIHGGFPVI